MKRPTVTDIARASGVSKTTVSKVMNVPADQLDVPESTRQRVLQASEELRYRPSWRARAFARGKTHTIGLMHVEAMRNAGLSDAALTPIQSRVTRELARHPSNP